ncbi:GNAT superfamily N-acetyltransferase [Paenibacillus peoriae]|uniref:GNAT superfamily N-acetyltransferase n=1 Tax=Paenibacillus peoriae TaxID=59893 RepID=A0ABU1QIA1_9BACL|nr:GNAT family N-acetyltransferase [Paenibacillus peoriae]MDR6779320.1 GNAT superfamily N-acetyltransferase [Paenibacillus peoriae]
MSTDDFIIAKLSEEDMDGLATFDCNNTSEFARTKPRARKRLEGHSKDMNYFLQNEALVEQDEGYNTTFLVKRNGELRAYMSLCADAIRLDYSERNNGAIAYDTFPSLKIARLAVHKDYHKYGYGKFLINYAVGKAFSIRNEFCGIKFITLDCFQHRLSYYENIGFIKNKEQRNSGQQHKPISLRLHIDDYLDQNEIDFNKIPIL